MVAGDNKSSKIDEFTFLNAVEKFLQSSPYHPCLLLVHPHIAQLRTAIEQLNRHFDWPTISVGTLLSKALLNVAPAKRSREAGKALRNAINQHRPGPLICTDIDLLFEPSLTLNPLHLLRQTSRQVTLVVTWPGTFENNVLAYAVPAHGHYRTWPQPDLCDTCIIPL